jgi:hypothetical protein
MNPLAIALVALALVPIGACVLARTAAPATAPNAKLKSLQLRSGCRPTAGAQATFRFSQPLPVAAFLAGLIFLPLAVRISGVT